MVLLLLGALGLGVWSASELSGQAPSVAAAKPKLLSAPNGFCANRVVREAEAFAPWRKFVVYETSGDARGPHVFKAAVSGVAYYCIDGRTQVKWHFIWDMSNISGTTITAQVHVNRADGTSRASKIFDLPPRSAWRCCDEAKRDPTLLFPKPMSRVTSISVVPLFNKNPTAYSVVDTKGGLHATFKLLPPPR